MFDSAGALQPQQVGERVSALRERLSINIGFHGHNNLSLAMANTLAAIEEGANRIDGSIRCLGAGAGNNQKEVLIAVLEQMGIKTGIDLYKIMDVAEDVIAPILQVPQEITHDDLVLGYAGVYSSFLLHARRAAKSFGIDSRDILIELGKRKVVGGSWTRSWIWNNSVSAKMKKSLQKPCRNTAEFWSCMAMVQPCMVKAYGHMKTETGMVF